MRAHLGNVALEIWDLALDVHGRPVFRLQPVGVTHLPCYEHAAHDFHTCELLYTFAVSGWCLGETCPSCAAPQPQRQHLPAAGRRWGTCSKKRHKLKKAREATGCGSARCNHERRRFAGKMWQAVPQLLRDKRHQRMHELQRPARAKLVKIHTKTNAV